MSTFVPGQNLRYRGDVAGPGPFTRAVSRQALPLDRSRPLTDPARPGAEVTPGAGSALLVRRKARARKARRLHEGDEDRPDQATLQLLDHEITYLSRSLRDLTARECEVVFAICRGGKNEWMADCLAIALPTLRTHLMRLNQKLGTRSKGDVVRLVAKALLDGYRRGAIEIPTAQNGSPAFQR